MFYFETVEEKRERILVRCNNANCKGFYTLIRQTDDFSPRVHSDCSECNGFMSVKLSQVEENRIISREWI